MSRERREYTPDDGDRASFLECYLLTDGMRQFDKLVVASRKTKESSDQVPRELDLG